MRVTALASQKDGSDKSILSEHPAVQVQRAAAGPVALNDDDPRASRARQIVPQALDIFRNARPAIDRMAQYRPRKSASK